MKKKELKTVNPSIWSMIHILLLFAATSGTCVFSQDINLQNADSIRIQVLKETILTPFAVDINNFSQFDHVLRLDTTLNNISGQLESFQKYSLNFRNIKKKRPDIRALVTIYDDGVGMKVGVTLGGYFIDESGKYCKNRKFARKIFRYG